MSRLPLLATCCAVLAVGAAVAGDPAPPVTDVTVVTDVTDVTEVAPVTPPGIAAFPRDVDLGPRHAGSVVADVIWLVNTSDRPRRVESVKGNCGCITVHVEPSTLEPAQALAVRYTMKVPSTVGTTKTKKMTFVLDEQDPLHVPIKVLAAETENAPEKREPTRGLEAAPRRVDLGDAPAGEPRVGEVWLINPTDAPLELVHAKSGCSCMKFVEFRPGRIAPGRASRVRFTMSAPRRAESDRTRFAYFLTADGASLPVPVRIRSR